MTVEGEEGEVRRPGPLPGGIFGYKLGERRG